MAMPLIETANISAIVPVINAPSRGKVLCFVVDEPLRMAIESALVRKGFSLFRAKDVWHAGTLATAVAPDVIIAEINESSSGGNELFDALRRNKKTADVSVLALIDGAIQRRPSTPAFQGATAVMLKSAAMTEIEAQVDAMITEKRDPSIRRIDPAISHIDAVFSEFGLRRSSLAPRRPMPRKSDSAKLPKPSVDVVPDRSMSEAKPDDESRSASRFDHQLPRTAPQPKWNNRLV